MSEGYVVTIKNWEKYNPKGDQKSFSWFRLENTIGFSLNLDGFTHEQKWVFIQLLCEVSKKNTGSVKTRLGILARLAESSKLIVYETLTELTRRRVITMKALPEATLEEAAIESESDARELLPNPDESARVPTESESVTAEPARDAIESARIPLATIRNVTIRNETEHIHSSPDGAAETELMAVGDGVTDDTTAVQQFGAPDLRVLWNENAGGLPAVLTMSEKRRASWKRRWADKPDLEYWKGVITRMAKSPFCRGESEAGWKADVEFFLKPDSHLKVMEGKYDPKTGVTRRQTYAEMNSAANQALYDQVDAEERAQNEVY